MKWPESVQPAKVQLMLVAPGKRGRMGVVPRNFNRI